MKFKNRYARITFVLPVCLIGANAWADEGCENLPSHSGLRAALQAVVDVGNSAANGGLANEMWGTVVNRDGIVCAVAFSGGDGGDQ